MHEILSQFNFVPQAPPSTPLPRPCTPLDFWVVGPDLVFIYNFYILLSRLLLLILIFKNVALMYIFFHIAKSFVTLSI